MPRNTPVEIREAFFKKNHAQLEDCMKMGLSIYRHSGPCRELVESARTQLGYSAKTSSVDIYRPLMRGYKAWRSRQTG